MLRPVSFHPWHYNHAHPPLTLILILIFKTDKFLEGIPLSTKIDFTCDVIYAGHAIDLGVTEKTTQAREKYWMHWSCYAKSVGIDPLILFFQVKKDD